MKHFLSPRSLLTAVVLAALLAATPAFAAGETSCGLLWRVENGATEPSYLFGTIHSEDPRVLDLPGAVTAAFQGSQTYVMELIPDFGAMATLMKTMYFRDQRNLKDLVGAELYRRTVEALESHGVGAGMAMKMKPWAAAVTLSFPKPKTGMFLDLMLYNRALRQEKKTVGLETAEEQLEFFTNLSMEEQITLLKATLKHQDNMYESFEKLTRAWLAREPETLMAMNRDYLKELPEGLAQSFQQEAIVQRNYRMAERVQPILQEGDAFIAVGALHLYGPEGVVQLLEQAGYSVTCVY